MKYSYIVCAASIAMFLLSGCGNSKSSDTSTGLGSEEVTESNITFSASPALVPILKTQYIDDFTVASGLKSATIYVGNADTTCITNSPGFFTGDGSIDLFPQGKECNATLTFNKTSATGTTVGTLHVSVVAPDLTFTFAPKTLTLANTNSNGTTVSVKIKDDNFVSPYKIYLRTNNAIVGVSPGYFEINDSQTHEFNLTVNNSNVNGPSGEANVTFGNAAADYNLTQTYPVNVAEVESVTRTITLQNSCPYTVYPAISGGGFGNGSDCPVGSLVSGDGKSCFWKNPDIGTYALETNKSTTITIPVGGYTSGDHIWSGGISARLKSDDNHSWVIADCSGDDNVSLEPCRPGTGFSSPSTVAEFTLLRSNNDTYDVTIITGVTIPISMKPTGHTAAAGSPYANGEAGATQAVGSNPAASWSFAFSDANITVDKAYFNFVDGNGSIACNPDNSCANGLVCGYSKDALFTYSAGGKTNTANYTLSCGKRLAYLSADAVWKANPDADNLTNSSVFDFYAVKDEHDANYPNSNAYKLWEFYECNTASGGPDTPYGNGKSNAAACGCTDWDGIANPTGQCVYKNAAWMKNVQPNITWAKKGCPTCYTFPYDDKTSTFTAYNAVSASNAANGTDYTITFCPDGKSIPGMPTATP